ncbi:MAG: hypothetical protein ACYDA9_15530 [Terriglobia bacterium]
MSRAVACHLKNSALEIKVGRSRLDVVAYSKRTRIFKVVECKKVSDTKRIGQTFGEMSAYIDLVGRHGFGFVDAFSKKVRMRFARWMEATAGGRMIHVEFYVALPDEACENFGLLKYLKDHHPDVGIIRVKSSGKCRDHIHCEGKIDLELSKGRAMTVPIEQPAGI